MLHHSDGLLLPGYCYKPDARVPKPHLSHAAADGYSALSNIPDWGKTPVPERAIIKPELLDDHTLVMQKKQTGLYCTPMDKLTCQSRSIGPAQKFLFKCIHGCGQDVPAAKEDCKTKGSTMKDGTESGGNATSESDGESRPAHMCSHFSSPLRVMLPLITTVCIPAYHHLSPLKGANLGTCQQNPKPSSRSKAADR